MKALRQLAQEVFGLFVDDGLFAALIVLWLLINGTLLAHIRVPRAWSGVILFAGLAAILLGSTSRVARRRRRSNTS